MHDLKWMEPGNCKRLSKEKQADFFASDARGIKRAKKACEGCPILEPCLEYALTHNIEHGVWGGTSGRQRKEIHKQQKLVNTNKGA